MGDGSPKSRSTCSFILLDFYCLAHRVPRLLRVFLRPHGMRCRFQVLKENFRKILGGGR
jgi:hypothetical protein